MTDARATRRALERLVEFVLPTRDREAILGDLAEEGLRAGSLPHAAAALRITVSYDAEPYRDPSTRLAALASLAIGIGLLWTVQAAGWSDPPPAELYRDPLSRLALELWAASYATSAVAAGLLAGHAPWVPPHARRTRWHVAWVLAALAWLGASPTVVATLPPLLLLSAAWLGISARDHKRDRPPNRV